MTKGGPKMTFWMLRYLDSYVCLMQERWSNPVVEGGVKEDGE